MNPRALLLRKNAIDTTLVQEEEEPYDPSSASFVLNLSVISNRDVRPNSSSHSNTHWPQTSDALCWYCCHGFTGAPLPMPVKYDDKRDIFHVTGIFCSWACMKSYNGESTSYLKHANANVITMFRKRCTGKLGVIGCDRKLKDHIVPAPPRILLKAFGGSMTIDEFRATSSAGKIFNIMPPRLIIHNALVEERNLAPTIAPNLNANVSFDKVRKTNETLRLKRPKPLTSHNLLERTMGISTM